jgi:C-terminal processing protease CtpA/Prc
VAEGRAIRLDSLGVAGFAIRRPAVSLQAEAGGLPLGVYDGLLGNNVLERFVLTLDYGHQRVTFEPGPYFDRPRPADRSGLGLSRGRDGALRVEGVIPGSPAERAGLRPGDELIAIDGRPAAECGPLYRLRETFRRDAGTEVRLSVRREDEAREARITLEDYF